MPQEREEDEQVGCILLSASLNDRYFILSERSYFGVFDVCYVELIRLIQFSHMFCWTNKRNGTMTICYKFSEYTTVLIHFEANFIIVESAGTLLCVYGTDGQAWPLRTTFFVTCYLFCAKFSRTFTTIPVTRNSSIASCVTRVTRTICRICTTPR